MCSKLNIVTPEELNAKVEQEDSQVETSSADPSSSVSKLETSSSSSDIKTPLINESQLIGDLGKPYALPFLLEGTRHRDLKTISSDTLARLMQGEFAKELGPGGRYNIIDCRYPYEYKGGHIRYAWNVYSLYHVRKAFPDLTEELKQERVAQRVIYVFYCEFSAMRAAKIMRFLRNHDLNEDYPELYLLHKGYNAFHGSYLDLCEPKGYVKMLSPGYEHDYLLGRLQAGM
ncbi:cdc25-like protein phosphatase twine [Drosophila serrata]|uniref:cdc25-like protein phosphatase twine n=1 Tax=Drosophila serrata TaxID=7274 RepID=UPI000A1D25B9|nr:cdc25-like protein phosphatase twine [Drosophila serrata]